MTQATCKEKQCSLLDATSRVVSAYIQKLNIEDIDLDRLIPDVYRSFASLPELQEQTISVMRPDGQTSKVSIEESIQDDYLVCLEDGKKLKMLKRYLKTNYNMTPEEYRKRWNLPASYPMVAPEYAKRRSQLAKDIGLGKDAARISRIKINGHRMQENA